MPRGPRLDTTNAFHHVMGRAIEQSLLFCSDTDRQAFVDRLGLLLPQAGASVYAWSLMPNHFHLLVRTGLTPLSHLMQRLLTGYALTFNRRHNRRGHLFQNRFKSILVDADSYLLELVRYIHLNPVRAGLVATTAELGCYRWTGHAMMLADDAPAWLAVGDVLEHFSPQTVVARNAYRRFVDEGFSTPSAFNDTSDGLVRGPAGWRLVRHLRRGREAWHFAERVLGARAFVSRVSPKPVGGEARFYARDPADVAIEVAKEFGLATTELTSGGRRLVVVRARNAAARVIVRDCGLSFSQTAKILGVSKWTVARALESPLAQPNASADRE